MTEEDKKEFEEFLEWKKQKREAEQLKAEQLKAEQQKTEQQKAEQQEAEQLKAEQQKAEQEEAEQSDSATPSTPLTNNEVEDKREVAENSSGDPKKVDETANIGIKLALAFIVILIIIIFASIKCSNQSSAAYSNDVDTTYVDTNAAIDDDASLDEESTYTPTVEVKNSGWDGSVKQVKDYLKYTLRDPDSYESIEWSEVKEKSDGYYVRHKYRAKNGFGGYVVANQLFHLDFSGNVVDVRDLY